MDALRAKSQTHGSDHEKTLPIRVDKLKACIELMLRNVALVRGCGDSATLQQLHMYFEDSLLKIEDTDASTQNGVSEIEFLSEELKDICNLFYMLLKLRAIVASCDSGGSSDNQGAAPTVRATSHRIH